MANWWDEAYSDITKWSVNSDQLNKDRGAYKDAFQMNAAEKGLNYELTSKLMNQSTNQEKSLMSLSADLDRRNTLDLMTGEHRFKIAGMQESNRLGKDYLAAEGFQTRQNLAEQGYQERRTQETVNKGMTDTEAIRAGASKYAQDSESKRSTYAQDAETKRSTYAQDAESKRSTYAQDSETRRVSLKGQEDRETIRTTGDEERKTYSYQRDTDADRAVRYSRR
jgi:hypothetical protein